jgi:hypothetical protein
VSTLRAIRNPTITGPTVGLQANKQSRRKATEKQTVQSEDKFGTRNTDVNTQNSLGKFHDVKNFYPEGSYSQTWRANFLGPSAT